ncbi:hypothetical protein RFI_08329 [Reticulomyxa filosa]|uniref:Uncharacterized protein n=1 Tax=Reticulomyxa filosa TaxID=46433 RepID=X6NR59_RETFI|nr:hypothetical protein RFI_08329 [Reticulomyxa filosa]|eukprot:ETO28800.1 hypothetical protein RFI_08329 [Reticulomyxa filosa]
MTPIFVIVVDRLYSVSHDQHLFAFDMSTIDCDIQFLFDAVIPTNEVMRDIISNNKSQNRGKLARLPSRRASMRETPKPTSTGKKLGHKRAKSKDERDDVKKDENEFVHLCVFEKYICTCICHSDALPQYKGQSVAEDSQYPFWCLSVSSDGAYVVTGNRKLRVFVAKSPEEGGQLSEPTRFIDTDAEHIKSVDCRNGLVVVTRKQIPRCKIFDLSSGKELHKFSCKEKDGGFVFAAFLCDRAHVVAITQSFGNQASPAVMRLYNYA